MTNEEIKKKLDYTARITGNELVKSALNIITLQEEVERLKAENEELTKVVSSKVYDLIDNAMEIADARKVWEQQAKIEAVKDFAEELKAKTMCIKEYEDGIRILQTSNKLIDQSVKIFLDELLKEVKE